MPTGYTAGVSEGKVTTLKDFALMLEKVGKP